MSNFPPRYRERQLITADLLSAEQSAQIEAWKQHRRYSHGWGVVYGLSVVLSDLRANGQNTLVGVKDYFAMTVGVGIAVDPDGRELKNLRVRSISKANLETAVQDLEDRMGQDLEAVVLCLRYARWSESSSALRVVEDCQLVLAAGLTTSEDALKKVVVSRVIIDPMPAKEIRESCELKVVPLARICLPLPVSKGSVDARFRRWAGLVGEYVESPSDRAMLRLGRDPRDALRRFGVAVPDAHGEFTDYRLSIDRLGRSSIKGPVTIHEDLRMKSKAGPVLELGRAAELPEGATPPLRPWSLYRIPPTIDPPQPEAIRIEIENPGKDADLERFQFGVGARHIINGSSHFVPIVSADALGAVRVCDALGKVLQLTEKKSGKEGAECAQQDQEQAETQQEKVALLKVTKGIEKKSGKEGAECAQQDQEQAETQQEKVALLEVTKGIIREGPIQPDLRDPRFAQRLFKESIAGEIVVQFCKTPEMKKLKKPQNGFRLDYRVEIENKGNSDLRAIQVFQSFYPKPPGMVEGKGTGFAVAFAKLEEADQPDPRMQIKIADVLILKANEKTVVLPPLGKDRKPRVFPFDPPTVPMILAVLAFGTAAVGSLIYAVRPEDVVSVSDEPLKTDEGGL